MCGVWTVGINLLRGNTKDTQSTLIGIGFMSLSLNFEQRNGNLQDINLMLLFLTLNMYLCTGMFVPFCQLTNVADVALRQIIKQKSLRRLRVVLVVHFSYT